MLYIFKNIKIIKKERKVALENLNLNLNTGRDQDNGLVQC